jgi:hypothetical protein
VVSRRDASNSGSASFGRITLLYLCLCHCCCQPSFVKFYEHSRFMETLCRAISPYLPLELVIFILQYLVEDSDGDHRRIHKDLCSASLVQSSWLHTTRSMSFQRLKVGVVNPRGKIKPTSWQMSWCIWKIAQIWLITYSQISSAASSSNISRSKEGSHGDGLPRPFSRRWLILHSRLSFSRLMVRTQSRNWKE